jgi:hypothetical protein
MFSTMRSVFLSIVAHDLLVREADYLVLPHSILPSVRGVLRACGTDQLPVPPVVTFAGVA